jgi:hypothetical protein
VISDGAGGVTDSVAGGAGDFDNDGVSGGACYLRE